MKITVTRTGGVTGMTQRWSIEITDDDELDDWRQLVDSCPWDHTPDSPQPDRYLYLIVAAEHEARVPEQDLQGPWRELTERVRERTRKN
ncbi:hypothetical protein LWF01_18620 [Saxibacter everestensis]|uniref:Uncharacterized protein n=1 Tax=Saxibacter everestensis TaxID=2909229 RepID=A0ABY8QUV3_9MICO|nr:hypothetical protein LWF01_18620 [Brevibacteriaceae bacterium ZFBP1038]